MGHVDILTTQYTVHPGVTRRGALALAYVAMCCSLVACGNRQDDDIELMRFHSSDNSSPGSELQVRLVLDDTCLRAVNEASGEDLALVFYDSMDIEVTTSSVQVDGAVVTTFDGAKSSPLVILGGGSVPEEVVAAQVSGPVTRDCNQGSAFLVASVSVPEQVVPSGS